SIVRRIWGRADMILFIFAGGAAEFALNKAVDWLYFTGRLPADPVGRLFSTVSYAKAIVFSEMDEANQSIKTMTSIHTAIEEKRGINIPDWAYRDVLYMLIDYSIRSFEIFERKATMAEKSDIFEVFVRLGRGMGIPGLPDNYQDWADQRIQHLERDLQYSDYTKDLYVQYRKHLGPVRYQLLLEAQRMTVPEHVKEYILEAIEIEKAGLSVDFNTTPEPLPEELDQVMSSNPDLARAFNALTPGRKRGYILYVSGAKHSKTRFARIKKSIARIMEGKGLHDR
ncbi:MAG: YdeI/OmpD-associated family protein, partial [Cyclobacteriaceae bacterium]